jgi:putative transposase
VLRNGARALLSQAVEAEVAALLGCHADKLTDDGRQRLVCHGHLPEREIMTGVGPVAELCPRGRDRNGEGPERIAFPRRSCRLTRPAQRALGADPHPLPQRGLYRRLRGSARRSARQGRASTIAKLKEAWSEEHVRWIRRDLSTRRSVYFWADGISS